VTDKISAYTKSEAITPVKGSNANSVVADKAQAETATQPATAQTGDTVTLTNSARSLQKIEETVARTPAVNSAKVSQVKSALQAGTYHIDAGRVADKLLQFERGLK
jgi:negative regulator of flagellin synthesis FlgM